MASNPPCYQKIGEAVSEGIFAGAMLHAYTEFIKLHNQVHRMLLCLLLHAVK
jgi:hypothetical protein